MECEEIQTETLKGNFGGPFSENKKFIILWQNSLKTNFSE